MTWENISPPYKNVSQFNHTICYTEFGIYMIEHKHPSTKYGYLITLNEEFISWEDTFENGKNRAEMDFCDKLWQKK